MGDDLADGDSEETTPGVGRRTMLRGGAATLFASAVSGCLEFVSGGGDGGTAIESETPRQDNDAQTEAQSNTPETTPSPGDPIEGEWPNFQYDDANRGYSDEAGTIWDDPSEHWRSSVPEEIFPESGVAIADNTVYVGTYGGSLYAFDGSSGEQLWRYEFGNDTYATPSVVDGTVYTGSVDNYLYAIDAQDGSLNWRYETGFPVNEHPVVTDGTVYVPVQNGPTSGKVAAVDAESGERRWQRDIGGDSCGGAAVADGVVYIGFGRRDNAFYAIDASTGEQRWRHRPTEDDQRYVSEFTTAVLGDGLVYTGFNTIDDDGGIIAFDRESGAIEWETRLGAVWASPALAESRLYVPVYRPGEPSRVVAVDTDSQSVEWSVDVEGRVRGSPVLTDDSVYVGNVRIDRSDGSSVGTVGSGRTLSQSAVAGDTLAYQLKRGAVITVKGGSR